MRNVLNIFVFASILSGYGFCQTKTNIEKFYNLIEKSVKGVLLGKTEKDSKVVVDITAPDNFALLKSSLIEKTGSFVKIMPNKENSDFIMSFALEDATVKYSETFTKSFLGRSYVDRIVALKGFAGVKRPNEPVIFNRFEYTERDTVEYKQLKELGNSSYPFTNPEIPSEPFFSSIWEPVIAIGIAVTTVYLLFTVRSK